MLGKLIKYEFKASLRLFMFLYATILLVSVISLIMDPFENWGFSDMEDPVKVSLFRIIRDLFLFGYILLVIAITVITIVVIIIRFYRNLLGDEGYLMFTLPVKTDALILSKLITSVVWSILSITVVIASLLILTWRFDVIERLISFMENADAAGYNIWIWVIGLLFSLLVYVISFITVFYAAMAIGANLTKNRLLGSFLGYIILYAIAQIISFISLFVIYVGESSFLEVLQESSSRINDQVSIFSHLFGYLFLYVNILNILLAVGYYVTTRYFIKNKLNLA